MKIQDCEYKGFKYEIHLANKGDWGKYKNHFYTQCQHNFNGGYALTLDEVNNNICTQIDKFINTIPNSIEELVEKIEDQLVWTGYEECHLDKTTTLLLIKLYLHKAK